MITPTAYHRMRVLWCLQALRDALRRWGAYVLVATGLLGAGTTGGLANAGAAAAWLVIPLWHEVAQSAARGALATAVQACVGGFVVWALRPLLLPRRWLETERALPLTRATRLRSDLRVVLWALAPLLALYVLAALPVLADDPAWLHPHRVAAVLALVVAAIGSLGLGVLSLQQRRRAAAPHRGPARTAASGRLVRPRAWATVLLLLPLVRGPARRCGGALAAGALLCGLPVAGLAAWPDGGGWWLAALGVAGLITSTRVGNLVREELVPLLAQTTMLPLAQARLRRGAAVLPALVWLPALGALPGWVAVGLPARAHEGLRPAVLLAFAVLGLATAVLEGFDPPTDPATRGARWIFALVLLLALASSVWA